MARTHSSPSGGPNNGGTKIFSVRGTSRARQLRKVKLGTRREAARMPGDARRTAKLKAVIPGGILDAVLPAEVMMRTDMDYDSIAKAGSMLGSGRCIVMDEPPAWSRPRAPVVFSTIEESCGQCTPCREGTGWLYRMVNRIRARQGEERRSRPSHERRRQHRRRTICALGGRGGLPVKSFIEHFPQRVPVSHRPQALHGDRARYSTSPSLPDGRRPESDAQAHGRRQGNRKSATAPP